MSRGRDVVFYGALALGAYALYRAWNFGQAATAAVQQGFSTTSSKVADVLDFFFPHASASFAPNSSVVLSTGQEIAVNAIDPAGVGSFTDTDGVTKIQFFYNGRTWRTGSALPDDTNTYYAV